MNATTNFTVKSLRANKVRTLVTIAGVALAADCSRRCSPPMCR